MNPTPFGSTPASGTCGTEYSGSSITPLAPGASTATTSILKAVISSAGIASGSSDDSSTRERVAVVDGHDPDPAVRVGDAGDHGPTTGNVQAPADQSSWIHV